MRSIYLSPHLDDAAFSCGGLIRDQVVRAGKVEIWTIFAGDPPEGPLSPLAEVTHEQWHTGRDAPAVRRQEDEKACRILGAAHRHLSFQDAIYRQGATGEWLYDPFTMWGEPHPAENALGDALVEFLSLSLRADDRLLCPLAVGGHVDHRLTRRAAERLGRPLQYYADVPYVLQSPEAAHLLTTDMRVETCSVSREGLQLWVKATAAYGSQIESFWPDPTVMQQQIMDYAAAGVRLWSSDE